MKKLIVNLLFFVIVKFSFAKNIFIDCAKEKSILPRQSLTSKGKNCLLINSINNDFFYTDKYEGFRPLIVIKVFDIHKVSYYENYAYGSNTDRYEDYLEQTVLPTLAADQYLSVTMLGQNSGVQSINTFDSLIIYNGLKYKIYTGVISAEFFNLIDFEQFHVMQTNQTILNTLAKTIKVHEWLRDSLPSSDAFNYELLCPKIYLLNKSDSIYTFFKYYYPDEHSPLAFYRGYVYKKDFGIIAFKSKYLYRIKDEYRNEIVATDEYYYFR